MFRPVAALLGDIACVLIFVAIGLASHGEPLSGVNLAWVAWPFLTGLLLGHLAIRAWRHPFGIWPQGVFVWAITVSGGMALRTLVGDGTATAFILVTTGVTAVLLLGWRAVASYLTRQEHSPAPALSPRAEPEHAEPENTEAASRD